MLRLPAPWAGWQAPSNPWTPLDRLVQEFLAGRSISVLYSSPAARVEPVSASHVPTKAGPSVRDVPSHRTVALPIGGWRDRSREDLAPPRGRQEAQQLDLPQRAARH